MKERAVPSDQGDQTAGTHKARCQRARGYQFDQRITAKHATNPTYQPWRLPSATINNELSFGFVEMPSAPGAPTLDQLQVLVQVVDTGSFTAAAKVMNRALSVISYTISNLEAQLGVSLFDRKSSRTPQLTEAGRVVLVEARAVVGSVGNLRAKVAGMLHGLEGELHVVLDCLLPPERVADALTAFLDTYPSVTLHLHGETLGAVADLVLRGTAVIGISGPFTAGFDDLHRISVGSLRMVPVAGRHHPLAKAPPGGHPPGAIREHVQLVVYDRSPLTKGQDFSVISSRTWRLGDLYSKHMLLRAGIGWGMMPLAMVTEDLAADTLVELDLPDGAAFDYPLDAIYRADTPPGPAACWLIERFRGQHSG